MLLVLLLLIGPTVAFFVADWARRFDSLPAKVLGFCAAVIAGNVAYLVVVFISALMNPAAHVRARGGGHDGWEVFGGTIVAAIVGLVVGDLWWSPSRIGRWRPHEGRGRPARSRIGASRR